MRKAIFVLVAMAMLVAASYGQPFLDDIGEGGPIVAKHYGGQSRRAIFTAPNDFWYNMKYRPSAEIGGMCYGYGDNWWQTGDHWAMWHLLPGYLNAERAWSITTGDTSLIIAISDQEVATNHYDLVGNRWYNWEEKAGTDGVDDDANGLVDDKWGWDFVYNDNHPWLLASDGDNTVAAASPGAGTQHGTQMASLFAAQGNNEPWVLEGEAPDFLDNRQGSVGIVWDAQIMAIKALLGATSSQPSSDFSARNSTQAILSVPAEYVSEMRERGYDVRVLNCSFLTANDVGYAVSRLIDAGVLPVTGSGNSNTTVTSGLALHDSVLTAAAVLPSYTKLGVEGANWGAAVDVSGYSASGGTWWDGASRYFRNQLPNYSPTPSMFTLGWSAGAYDGILFPMLQWEAAWEEGLGSTAIVPIILPTAGYTSGATAQSSGVAALLFSAYPEVTPLKAIGMIRRGAVNIDSYNTTNCGGAPCAGLLGAGRLDAYRTLTLWGAVGDTTLSGDVYVSGDVAIPAGTTVMVAAGTVFHIAPDDIYSDTMGCEAQYVINKGSYDNEPASLMDPDGVEIYVAGTLQFVGAATFESWCMAQGDDDWGGIWIQTGGAVVNDASVTYNNTIRGDK